MRGIQQGALPRRAMLRYGGLVDPWHETTRYPPGTHIAPLPYARQFFRQPVDNRLGWPTKNSLHSTALFLHLLDAAALLGGWLATFRRPTVGAWQLAET